MVEGFCISLNGFQQLKRKPLTNLCLHKAAFIGSNPVRVQTVISFLSPLPLMERFTSQHHKDISVTSVRKGTLERWERRSHRDLTEHLSLPLMILLLLCLTT